MLRTRILLRAATSAEDLLHGWPHGGIPSVPMHAPPSILPMHAASFARSAAHEEHEDRPDCPWSCCTCLMWCLRAQKRQRASSETVSWQISRRRPETYQMMSQPVCSWKLTAMSVLRSGSCQLMMVDSAWAGVKSRRGQEARPPQMREARRLTSGSLIYVVFDDFMDQQGRALVSLADND